MPSAGAPLSRGCSSPPMKRSGKARRVSISKDRGNIGYCRTRVIEQLASEIPARFIAHLAKRGSGSRQFPIERPTVHADLVCRSAYRAVRRRDHGPQNPANVLDNVCLSYLL